MRFRRITDGQYVSVDGRYELHRATDDSDGYDRTEWTVWTANRGRCVAITPTLNEAKTRVRAFDRAV